MDLNFESVVIEHRDREQRPEHGADEARVVPEPGCVEPKGVRRSEHQPLPRRKLPPVIAGEQLDRIHGSAGLVERLDLRQELVCLALVPQLVLDVRPPHEALPIDQKIRPAREEPFFIEHAVAP